MTPKTGWKKKEEPTFELDRCESTLFRFNWSHRVAEGDYW